jgi:hypothetical protein
VSAYYHDDPIEPEAPKGKKSSVFAALVLVAVGGFYLQSTFAANISINSGTATEFGQGVSQAVACSGATNLTVTPSSTFVNANNATGTHYFGSLKVSNIPNGCYGADFIINAFGNTDSTPLALFNSTSTSAVVYDNNGTFELGAGTLIGASIASGSGTFTLTFTNPVASSSAVFKVTLQSGAHTVVTCALGGTCSVGDTGPAGGTVFYALSAGFNCGPTFSATGSPTGGQCHYLEAATSSSSPSWSDAVYAWSGNTSVALGTTSTAVGAGYRNTLAMVTQSSGGNTASRAGTVTRAYLGGGKSDWYLPSENEITQLMIRKTNVSGLLDEYYWTSTEINATVARPYYMLNGYNGGEEVKTGAHYVRPIRAF